MLVAAARIVGALGLVFGAVYPATAGEYRASSYVFGTLAEVTAIDDDGELAQRAVASVLGEFDRMHRELHTWKPGPLMSLNDGLARGESVHTTHEIATMILEAQRLSLRSNGLFDPAIGRLVGLWNFHRDRPGGPLPDAKEIARIMAARPRIADLSVRGDVVSSVNPAVRLDFGGYAKGYALDRAASLLRASGIRDALVNVGGNVLALGRRASRPWRVALDAPRGPGLLAVIDLMDGDAIGTSGDYRRYYEIDGKRYAHIIDPRSGYPVSGVESVTVLVPARPGAGALSDAASKPIFIEGVRGWRSAAARMGIADAMLIDSNGRLHVTAAMKSRLRFADASRAAAVVE